MKRTLESTVDFKLRIAAIVGDEREHIVGARPPHPLLVRSKKPGKNQMKRRRHRKWACSTTHEHN
jgi:hypothetical protein